jgi:hypothetical protein
LVLNHYLLYFINPNTFQVGYIKKNFKIDFIIKVNFKFNYLDYYIIMNFDIDLENFANFILIINFILIVNFIGSIDSSNNIYIINLIYIYK